MSDETKNSQDVNINFSPIQLNLSDAATTFLNRASDLIGGLAKPWQLKRVARAEAEAAITKATAEIKIDDLQRRALTRFASEQAQQQITMEFIAAKAGPLITDKAKQEDVADDWITNFFQRCRHVSDDEMQTLWARILAGEVNNPGFYSKRTLLILESLDKREALMFAMLCKFAWRVGPLCLPIITSTTHLVYSSNGLSFADLNHLQSIGLITLGDLTGYGFTSSAHSIFPIYDQTQFVLRYSGDEPSQFPVGQVMLTLAGQELSRVVQHVPVPGFEQHVLSYWKAAGWVQHESRPVSSIPTTPQPDETQLKPSSTMAHVFAAGTMTQDASSDARWS